MDEHEYGKANNVAVSCRRPGWRRFAYADTAAHRADRLFIRSELPVKFEKDMSKPGCAFEVVICRVRASREGDFLRCMADLERALAMEGHADYPAFCEEMIGPLRGE